MQARSIRLWARLHTGSSLLCTVFLLVLCVTGLPLIFHDEIDGLTVPPIARQSPPGAAALPLAQLVARAQARYPDQRVQFIFWPPDTEGVVHIGLAPDHEPDKNLHRVVLDAGNGAVLSEPSADRGMMAVVLRAHSELFAGVPGTLFVGAVGLVFIVALVSGLVLYGPFMRKSPFGRVRSAARRTRWLDLHNLLSVVTVTWALAVGVTGIVNALEKPLFAMWRGQELPKLLAPYAGKPAPAVLAPIDDAIAVARAAAPGTTLTSVLYPYSRFTSPRHYLVWTKGNTPFTAHLFSAILIDVETGRLTTRLALPWYLRTLEISRPLHFGDYGGLPLKIIWALFDLVTIVVLVSGLYLWIGRKRRTVQPS